jgi:hypothetical protein
MSSPCRTRLRSGPLRLRSVCRLLLSLGAALAMAGPPLAHAAPLHVAVGPIPCNDRDSIGRALVSGTAHAMATQPEMVLLVSSRDEQARSITLTLVGGRSRFEQTIAFRPSDCPELPKALLLLVQGWLSRDWRVPGDATLAADLGEPAAEPSATARAPLQGDSPSPPSATSPHETSRFSFDVLAGAFVDPQGHAGASGSLSLGADLSRPWGLGLVATYHAPVHAQGDIGWASADVWGLGAALRGRFGAAGSRVAVDVLAGPALRVVRARSGGFSINLPETLLDAALASSVRLRLRIDRQLWWLTSAEVWLSPHRERLQVGGAGTALTLSPARFSLSTGIGWHPF